MVSPSRNKLPFVARTLMPREVQVNALMAVTLGALEGGLLGVIVKIGFAGAAAPAVINLAVAMVAGAPAFANVASLAFANLAHGRHKTRWVSALMAACAGCALMIALSPVNAAGLVWLVFWMIAARLCWAGVVTLRAAIWRANFPRHVRATITGRIAVTYSLLIAGTAAVTGVAMEFHDQAWRGVLPITALMGFIAAWRYRRFTVRGHGRLLREETDARGQGRARIADAIDVLKTDVWYRRYMATMFVFGAGNLMVIALLVVILTEQLGVSRLMQVLITTTIPLLALATFTPVWARYLDKVHILEYRAWHSWMFVATMALFVPGAIFGQVWLFWLGALMLGAAFAGGRLGWNLGHNDFASDGRSTLYMGIHVTLTGIRGLIAPLVGVGLYQWLESMEPGRGRFVLLFPFTLTLAGAVTFVLLAHIKRREADNGTGNRETRN
ncbi:MAG: MFS transporter [Wenzhouxiangellaceae bacterium]|nr:MFS transporter [Wenzhouxiangellaceae bacterium]